MWGGMALVAVLALLLTGWQAFNPGALTAVRGREVTLGGYASHAEFERQCGLCHQPYERPMSELCMDCHANVRTQIEATSGLHGKVNPSTTCQDCHPDHLGRKAEIGKLALPHFDQLTMHFSLSKHAVDYGGQPIDCLGCHNPDDPTWQPVDGMCQDCHAAHDAPGMQAHAAEYGADCSGCHDGLDSMAGYDHTPTSFLLDLQHADLACVDCHQSEEKGLQMFAGLETACVSCHAQPRLHAGFFGDTCENCHTSAGWLPVTWEGETFDHNVTGFNLAFHAVDYAGQPINCKSCHPAHLGEFSGQACIDCHHAQASVWMDVHETIMGEACVGCHDGADRMRSFDHSQVYALTGRHAKITCNACHGGDLPQEVYRGLHNQCQNCHPEPELHAGTFGQECQHCHDATAWSPAYLRDHLFPFDHGGATLTDCQLCHTMAYPQHTCYGCHDHQPGAIAASHEAVGISGPSLAPCLECHPDGKLAANP